MRRGSGCAAYFCRLGHGSGAGGRGGGFAARGLLGVVGFVACG